MRSVRRVNTLLLVIFLATVALNWAVRAERAQPHLEFLPEMVRSVAAESFAPHAAFADGKTLQPPPAGTVRRGLLPLPYRATPEDARRAGEELANPFALGDRAALAHGAQVFANFCVVCHGAGGTGDGPVAQRGFPPPASLRSEKAMQLRDGQIFHILTYGQGNMPAHAAQVSREDRWKTVLYVRTLQSKVPVQAAGGRP